MSDIGRWGPWCVKCGHPSSYHGVTFCQVPAGADRKRNCDCDGYVPFVAESSALLESDAIVIRRQADGSWPEDSVESIAELLWRLDAGGWSALTSYGAADDESKDYWREAARSFLDSLVDSSKAPE